MRGTLSYRDLESVFDWRMFAAVCGIKMGSLTPEASTALAAFRAEALDYLEAGYGIAPAAEYDVRFFACRRRGDVIVSEDGVLRLPMLRQGSGERRSLCDLFPSAGTAERLGLFAIKVDAPDGETNSLIAHAARVCLAEAASEYLCRRFQKETGRKTFMPAVGYPCCPDHSLKRDILQLLDIDIQLTDSCSMIPEASICGMVISSDDFSLFDIRDARPDELEKYSELRGFDQTQKRLYLYSLLNQ